MTTWTQHELTMIGGAQELQLASLRRDSSLRKPVTIWVVRHGDDLYVRSYNGRAAAWFRGMAIRHIGTVRAGGISKDVTFAEETDPDINDQIDAAYRAKYRSGGGYVTAMVAEVARAATIKLVPRAMGHSYEERKGTDYEATNTWKQ